jgi:hypothetical protein
LFELPGVPVGELTTVPTASSIQSFVELFQANGKTYVATVADPTVKGTLTLLRVHDGDTLPDGISAFSYLGRVGMDRFFASAESDPSV